MKEMSNRQRVHMCNGPHMHRHISMVIGFVQTAAIVGP